MDRITAVLLGPRNNQRTELQTNSLDDFKMIFDQRDRTVTAYVRDAEISANTYLHSPFYSGRLTEIYDEASAKWGNHQTMRVIPQKGE